MTAHAQRVVCCPGRRAQVMALIMFVAVLGLSALYAAELYQRYHNAQAVLQQIEPRYARLTGLLGEQERIHAALTTTQASLARYAYPASVPLDRVGAEVQQRVRALAEAAGLTVSNSQITAPREHEHFIQINFAMTVVGDAEAFVTFSARLSQQEPLVRLDQINLNAFQLREGTAGIRPATMVQMNLSAFRIR